MTEYEEHLFDLTNNPNVTYYKLSVNGKCSFDDFLKEIEKNVSDRKHLNSILAYMDSLGAQLLPSTIYNHIKNSKRTDLFEFKKDRLRVYVIDQRPNIYIVMGGYKGNQVNDISNLNNKTKDFPKQQR